MRDYATISKRLRRYSENCVAYKLDADFADAVSDAADAIEELLAEVKHWELEAAANETDRNYLIDENRKLVNSLMNFRVPTWISVEERLPHYLDHVLCVNKYGIQMVGYLTDYKEGGFRCESGMDSCDYITHWMPLPEPPKGVE